MHFACIMQNMHGINPSQQKCLAGLDDVIAAAMIGFEILKNASDFFKRTDLKDVLEKSKWYLKTQYQWNCNDTTPISSHNIVFVLSANLVNLFKCQVK